MSSKKDIGEKCGVVAVWTKSTLAAQIARRASIALQHRGQESSGIAVYCEPKGLRKRFNVFGNGGFIKVHIGMGLIARVLSDDLIKSLGPTHVALAHNRYSTSGGSSLMNAHPVSAKSKNFRIAIAHNGNVPDTTNLRSQVKNHPSADTDTALIAALLVEQRPKYKSWEETFIQVLPKIKGAFSLTVLTEDGCIYGIRDPFGIRPLSFGELEDGFIIASETVAIDAVGASFIRDVCQGEILKIDKEGKLTSYFFGQPQRLSLCLFEHIYFSRPDSFINGKRIKDLRRECGKLLAQRLKKKGIKPDIVIPIFNSGYFAARGVSEQLGVPLIDAIITSNYFGRTFINPGQEMRINAVYGKHSIIPDGVLGKKVVFVDDSIVRSNTSAILARALKDAGAVKVYAAIASPPVVNQCDMGIDMRSRAELPASKFEGEPIDKIEDKMANLIKVDSLTYLPLKDTTKAMGGGLNDFYSYPFGGKHPVRDKQEEFPRRKRKLQDRVKLLILSAKTIPPLDVDMELIGVVNTQDELAEKVNQQIPDILLVTDFEEELMNDLILDCQNKEIVIIRFVPHLVDPDTTGVDENFGKLVRTSRGLVEVFHGENSAKISFKKKLPVSGASVYQVMDKGKKHLPILKEEVRREPKDSLKIWLSKMEEAKRRVLDASLKRVVHVLSYSIDLSRGEFPW